MFIIILFSLTSFLCFGVSVCIYSYCTEAKHNLLKPLRQNSSTRTALPNLLGLPPSFFTPLGDPRRIAPFSSRNLLHEFTFFHSHPMLFHTIPCGFSRLRYRSVRRPPQSVMLVRQFTGQRQSVCEVDAHAINCGLDQARSILPFTCSRLILWIPRTLSPRPRNYRYRAPSLCNCPSSYIHHLFLPQPQLPSLSLPLLLFDIPHCIAT
jgi:hypothetical protein